MDKEKNVRIVALQKAGEGPTTPLPEMSAGVQAGFPSPAEDYVEKHLDLNELVIRHPAATFYVRVEGDSMRDAGIQSGDLLVVDRSLEPANGKIVVAVVNGEFTVKRIKVDGSGLSLVPENANYPSMPVSAEADFQVWGVVTYVIHRAQ